MWSMSHRFDPFSAALADRHYNRQKVGSPQFAPPGRCLVLKADAEGGKAFWITSWQKYVLHAWAGAWVCSAFRTEGLKPASVLIRDAVSATKAYYGSPPAIGMITFIDTQKVKPIKIRGQLSWGWTYCKAGFQHVGKTKGGLLVFQLLPVDMPPAKEPIGFSGRHKDFASTLVGHEP